MTTPVARKQVQDAPPAPVATAGPETPPPVPAEVMGATTTAVAGPDVTAPRPPALDEQGVALADGIAAGWVYHRAITHLWSYDAPTGVWVWVDGIGWKRLSPVSEHGHSHMCVLATMATHNNLPVDYHENAAGQIDQLLV